MVTLFENFFILLVVLAGLATFGFFGVFVAGTLWRFVQSKRR